MWFRNELSSLAEVSLYNWSTMPSNGTGYWKPTFIKMDKIDNVRIAQDRRAFVQPLLLWKTDNYCISCVYCCLIYSACKLCVYCCLIYSACKLYVYCCLIYTARKFYLPWATSYYLPSVACMALSIVFFITLRMPRFFLGGGELKMPSNVFWF